MKFVSILLLMVTGLLLISCDSERIRHRRLSEQSAKLLRANEILENKIRRYKAEQKKYRQHTAKERFAYLYNLQQDNGKELIYEQDILSIRFKRNTVQVYDVLVKIKPADRACKPNFLIYLYDQKGLIIGYCHQKKRFYNKAIPKGQLQERRYTIKLLEASLPTYFGIVYPTG